MFFRESAGSEVLRRWLFELFPDIRTDCADSSTLDEISATEILDLAYIESGPFDTATAAHVLYPEYVESSERMPVPSAMAASFPVAIEEIHPSLAVDIRLRCGRPSELKIGQAGTMRVTNPRRPVPAALLNPRISGTSYDLQEPGGQRVRSLAGPLAIFERVLTVNISTEEGESQTPIVIQGGRLLYGSEVNSGLRLNADADGRLLGQPTTEAQLRRIPAYLWSEAHEARVLIDVRWRRTSTTSLELAVAARNVTPEPPDREAKDALLDALILPHIQITVHRGQADFPPLQYADAKRFFLGLNTDQEHQEGSARRLYAVRQSGCIATKSPRASDLVTLTTFGIFDTPRELPVAGPEVRILTQDVRTMLAQFDQPSDHLRRWLETHWVSVSGIIRAAAEAFGLQHLHRFQWDAIAMELQFLADNRYDPVTVVRAPTGGGKTIVFFVNAAISSLCGPERSTSILMFPTRLLNEDMFRRLIAFVAKLRANLPDKGVTGGILMGTSDPLYKLLLEPEPGEPMYHYGQCPHCGATPLHAVLVASRLVPECSACGHRLDYMFNPLEVLSQVPDLVIATPDKLLYEATANPWDSYGLPFFGAPALRCDLCGRACAVACITLKPAWQKCSVFDKKSSCGGTFLGPPAHKLIRYMGFDEVHSLYGETATYVSMFLANLETMQAVLSRRREAKIRYETATATIANELMLLSALTRRPEHEIVAIPEQDQMHEYFEIVPGRVRHRVLTTLPTRVSSREAFIRAMLNALAHQRGSDLNARLRQRTATPNAWQFLLGYLFKKQEGSDMRRALRDMFRNAFNVDLTVEFLSGEAPKDQISRIVQQALSGNIDVLLANLVISLGVDIHDLNHMIMLGVPRSFTEYVQTAGRTGRGESPGHVHVILQPFYPRDAYLYRHFHAILSDVAGYYDVLPVRSTNLFCANEMFGNVAKSLLNALCMNPSNPQWANSRGIRAIMATMDGRIQGAIARILCDDPALASDVRTMVDTRLNRLIDDVSANDWLSSATRDSEVQWLIYSLRGKSGATVRVRCMDQLLMERLQAPSGDDSSEEASTSGE